MYGLRSPQATQRASITPTPRAARRRQKLLPRHSRWFLIAAAISLMAAFALLVSDSDGSLATAGLGAVFVFYAGFSMDRPLPYRRWQFRAHKLWLATMALSVIVGIATHEAAPSISQACLIAFVACIGWMFTIQHVRYPEIERAAKRLVDPASGNPAGSKDVAPDAH